MQSMARPLGRLYEDSSWFARATDLQLLYVRTSAEIANPALGVVMAGESHADNKGLFFRFDDPESPTTSAWNDRAKRLHAQYDDKRKGLAEAEIVLGDVGPEPTPQSNGLTVFSALLGKLLDALVAPIEGVVLVFAPVRVEAGCPLLTELPTMARTLLHRHVRFVVVERDTSHLAGLPATFGSRALTSHAMVDPQDLAADMAALAGDSAPGTAAVAGPRWKGVGAGPDVIPPPRPNQPPPPSDEAIVALGLSPAYVKGGGQKLKELVIGAALQLKGGNHREALHLQSEAASLCEGFAMPKLHILNLQVLASYCLAAQIPSKAVEIYQRAETLAVQGGHLDQAAQIEMALAMMDARAGHPADAMIHYRKAGELAEEAKLPSLAVEAWRMAGQLAIDNKSNEAAVTAWKRALAVVAPLSANEAKGTSAAEVARGLASILRKSRQIPQAESLEATAYRIEHGLPADAPVTRA
jgi:tetratricopeptide (TPR) repeat protein